MREPAIVSTITDRFRRCGSTIPALREPEAIALPERRRGSCGKPGCGDDRTNPAVLLNLQQSLGEVHPGHIPAQVVEIDHPDPTLVDHDVSKGQVAVAEGRCYRSAGHARQQFAAESIASWASPPNAGPGDANLRASADVVHELAGFAVRAQGRLTIPVKHGQPSTDPLPSIQRLLAFALSAHPNAARVAQRSPRHRSR